MNNLGVIKRLQKYLNQFRSFIKINFELNKKKS